MTSGVHVCNHQQTEVCEAALRHTHVDLTHAESLLDVDKSSSHGEVKPADAQVMFLSTMVTLHHIKIM